MPVVCPLPAATNPVLVRGPASHVFHGSRHETEAIIGLNPQRTVPPKSGQASPKSRPECLLRTSISAPSPLIDLSEVQAALLLREMTSPFSRSACMTPKTRAPSDTGRASLPPSCMVAASASVCRVVVASHRPECNAA